MVSFSLRQHIFYLLLKDPTPVSFHLSQFVPLRVRQNNLAVVRLDTEARAADAAVQLQTGFVARPAVCRAKTDTRCNSLVR